MTIRRFSVGQTVRLTNHATLSPAAALVYTIQAPLPMLGNIPQYRLQNEHSLQQRVASERDLEPVDLI